MSVSKPPPPRSRIDICFLAGTLVADGAERQLVYMLRALQDAPVSRRVLCLTRGEALEEEVRALGVPVEYVGADPSRPARLIAITRALRREPVHIVQSTHYYTNLYAALAAKANRAVSIGAIRNDLSGELRANGVFGWGHLMLPQYLVANSRSGREKAIERGRSPGRVMLVQNAVDIARFGRPGDERVDRDDGSLRLLLVGRLVPQKRVDRFLRMVEAVSERLPHLDVEAKIAGDGPLEQELHRLARARRLEPGRVEFVGRVADPVPLYRWADLLVLTSDWEGTPNVVLEALAGALPVVATAVGGTPDVLAEGGGVLVDPQDEAGLVDSVVRLALDPRARSAMGQVGRRQVVADRSFDSLRRRLHVVYRTALARQRG